MKVRYPLPFGQVRADVLVCAVSKRLRAANDEFEALVMRSRICAALQNWDGVKEAEQQALQLIAKRPDFEVQS